MKRGAASNLDGSGPPSEKLVFLVVEDDATSRMILKRALERMGYEVLLAPDGETGVAFFAEHHVDMVLMDLQLPGIDGYEATRKIKRLSGDEFVPVIFLTSTTDEDRLARCVLAGGDDFLSKPYSSVILSAKIGSFRRIRKLHREIRDQRDVVAQHRSRLLREQELAERLFSNILNQASGASDAVRCMVSPASIFNGDLVLHAETPSGGVRVLVGDFTGHGLQAAIGALPATDIFRSMTAKGSTISDVVSELNKKLHAILPTRMFFACALMELDPEYNRLLLWNGGMPDVFVMSDCGTISHRLAAKHLALGIRSNDWIRTMPENIPIEVGDRVYLYSDGIIEAAGTDGEMFGRQRLEAFVSRNAGSPGLFEDLGRELLDFTGPIEQDDDFTLVEVHHKGRRPVKENVSIPQVVRAPLNWRAQLVFDADALRNVDPLPLLMQLTVDLQGLQGHRERIYMVLAELFFNALDHGLLRLDSSLKESPEGFTEYYSERAKRLAALEVGRISLALDHRRRGEGGFLRISVEDSGPGFDFEASTHSLESNVDKSGRGMALIHDIAEEIVYSKGGTRAEVLYVWDNDRLP